ncbi:protein bride of sevenless [Malaya genurostris]|uniref:protein bride of sevenless n=1 Tax=Malaya genurostris TaxID=325434 RepID=UPI0026F3EA69|nr:protein bride of sevenless [Malaya genurostris]XP_058448307.1 protein bride of sevenless [Malaya genurostris]XP_058448308.1 protein bride of sevenless [Malaya genurostris]XP_058448309.1 protein bride of sevenless [Malaya genurostris]XP_058448310.1 protein bride of sevenless [Malaya genurostris]XP_058448311.1 protein bride of sevenless [Malaya genurostris]
MRRKQRWCEQLCLAGGLLLLYGVLCGRCDEAIPLLSTTQIAVEVTAELTPITESIDATKVIEEITDNSITTISPTRGQHRKDFDPLETDSTLTTVDDIVKLLESTTSYSSLGENPIQLATLDSENYTDSVTYEKDTLQKPQNCSSNSNNRILIDLSVGGDFRRSSSRAHTHHEAPISYDDRVAEEAEHINDTLPPTGLGNSIYLLDGDYTISLITDQADFGAILFIVDRINELQLINNNGTLGLRIMFVQNRSAVQQMLEEEFQYSRECSPQIIGVFVSRSLWSAIQPVVNISNMPFNIHAFPSSNDLLYAMAAHLLYELPWTNPNSSLTVRSDSVERSEEFIAMCRHHQLCLDNLPGNNTISVILGAADTINFSISETLIVILSGQDKLFVSDLPDGSYVIAENEINLSALENQLDIITNKRYGTKLLSSDILTSASVFLEIVKLLNLLTHQNCHTNGSDRCGSFNETFRNWKYYAKLSSQKIVAELELENLTQLMTFEMRQKFSSLQNTSDLVLELRPIASSNIVTNVTTVYQLNELSDLTNQIPMKLGNIFYCTKEFESRHPDFGNHHRPIYYGSEYVEMYWQIRQEPWVAAGLTIASLGILFCMAILIFLVVRVCMEDVLEGNPLSSILLLVSLIFQFSAFLPFSMEYTGYLPQFLHKAETIHKWNTLCTVKIFVVSVCYCITFSLLLCRAIMLASIGSEGGFLSHVNGYLQSVICVFSTLVQLGLSSQLVIVLHANARSLTCDELYFGNWFWAIIAYDGLLLVALVSLSPLVFRSQRNYREGILLVTGSILCLVIWITWIPLSMFGYEWREAAVSLGLVATATAILVGVMVPRCFLMVRSIARSDLVQALPSLTSLAFAQSNQYMSEQSVYECVNPAMRQQRSTTADSFLEHDAEDSYMATSEIPTLPLRGRSQQPEINGNGLMNFYGVNNAYGCPESLASELSPNKITRF